jgi:hypothetical protein
MLSRTLLLALVAAAFAPAVASAATDSAIVYVNDGDVWRVAPDGAGAHALTTDGTTAAPYARPRLAPDGSVWALKGFDVVHLDASGQRVGGFTPPKPKDSEGVASDDAPKFLDLSPDGTTLAYGVANLRCEDGGHCNTDGITEILDTNGTVLSAQVGIVEAAFVTRDRLVGNEGQFEGTLRLTTRTGPSTLWYRDGIDVFTTQPGVPREPALSPDTTQLAALRTVTGVGVGVFTYRVPAQFGLPTQMCVINNVLLEGASPTFSPDGRRLAVAQRDGLAVYDLGAVTQPSECATKGTMAGIAAVGASQPDWGTIETPDRPHQEPDPPAQTTMPVATPPAPAATLAALKLTIPSQRLSAILKRGLKVKLSARATVKLTYKGKVVGTASGSAGTVTVKLAAAGRKALRNAKKATLTISAGTATQTVTVRR